MECWSIVKWYCIIDKVVFLDGKIKYDGILGCECSNKVLGSLGGNGLNYSVSSML